MRLDQFGSTIETNGQLQTKRMSVAMNGKAVAILLDKIYKDIRFAIVRELITNGYDSHKERGNPERPLLVHLPSIADTRFKVRDYGMSMSDDLVTNLYMNLMESTKDASNDAVGGWGIGSKTPLGYTDQLTVRCFKDNNERLYHLFKGSDGTPELVKIAEFPTEEEQGVEISFEVKPKDWQAFENFFADVCYWMDTVPTSNRRKQLPNEYTAIAPGVLRHNKRRTGDFAHKASVRQGCVAYPIDESLLLEFDSLDSIKKSKATMMIDCLKRDDFNFLDVKIGTVTVTASRDAIYYEEKTAHNLVDALASAYDEFQRIAKADIDALKTLHDAKVLSRSGWESYGIFAHMMRESLAGFKFNGHDVRQDFSADMWTWEPIKDENGDETGKMKAKLTYEGIEVSHAKQGKRCRFDSSHKFFVGYRQPLRIVVDQLDAKSQKFLSHGGERLASVADFDHTTLWVRVTTRSLDGLQAFLRDLGSPADVIQIEDIEHDAPKRAKRDTSMGPLTRRFSSDRPKGSHTYTSKEKFDEIVMSGEYFTIKTHRNVPAGYHGIDGWSQLERLRDAVTFDVSYPVLMLPKAGGAKFTKARKEGRDFVEYCMELLIKDLNPKLLVECAAIANQHSYKMNYSSAGYATLQNLEPILYPDGASKADPNARVVLTGEPLIDSTMEIWANRSWFEEQVTWQTTLENRYEAYASDADWKAYTEKKALLQSATVVPIRFSNLYQLTRDIERQFPAVAAFFGDEDDTPESTAIKLDVLSYMTQLKEKLTLAA